MLDTAVPQFPDALTLAAARARFFALSNLGDDGGYADRWVRVETRPIAVYFPNTACRVAAAKLHDLHHVATEYRVDWTGEAEIAGWEIASGCGAYGWAWMLNLGAFTVGLFRSPARLFQAFVLGRRAPTNLYHEGFEDSRLSAMTVGELRQKLGVGETMPRPCWSDRLAFAAWAIIGVGWHALAGAVLVTLVLLTLRGFHVI